MKTIKYLLMIAAVTTIAFTACTQDADSPTLPTPESDERPISFAASMPVIAWGVESKATTSYPEDLTLYFKMKGSDEWSTCVFKDLADLGHTDLVTVDVDGNNLTFQALYAYQTKVPNYHYDPDNPSSEKYVEQTEHRDLVWSLLEEEAESDGKKYATFYLTATKDNIPFWATATVEDGQPVSFGEMKPRKTRFTVQLTVEGNAVLDENSFTFSLTNVLDAETTASDVTKQNWPTVASNPADYNLLSTITYNSANTTYTATADFAPQTVGNLTISYGTTKSWEVNLSNIYVKNTNNTSHKANEWNAGEHITLNVKVTLNSLGTPIITVEGFTADSSEHNFNGTVTTTNP